MWVYVISCPAHLLISFCYGSPWDDASLPPRALPLLGAVSWGCPSCRCAWRPGCCGCPPDRLWYHSGSGSRWEDPVCIQASFCAAGLQELTIHMSFQLTIMVQYKHSSLTLFKKLSEPYECQWICLHFECCGVLFRERHISPTQCRGSRPWRCHGGFPLQLPPSSVPLRTMAANATTASLQWVFGEMHVCGKYSECQTPMCVCIYIFTFTPLIWEGLIWV